MKVNVYQYILAQYLWFPLVRATLAFWVTEVLSNYQGAWILQSPLDMDLTKRYAYYLCPADQHHSYHHCYPQGLFGV